MKRSTPEQVGAWRARSRQLARRNPVKAVSDRRRDQRPDRARVRAAVLERDGHKCQAQARAVVPPVCSMDGFRLAALASLSRVTCGGPLDCHEIIPRSAWADGHLVESNVVAVCRMHHTWIGDNPQFAHALHLHGHSWERPA